MIIGGASGVDSVPIVANVHAVVARFADVIRARKLRGRRQTTVHTATKRYVSSKLRERS
jgi:hypothetical protein